MVPKTDRKDGRVGLTLRMRLEERLQMERVEARIFTVLERDQGLEQGSTYMIRIVSERLYRIAFSTLMNTW